MKAKHFDYGITVFALIAALSNMVGGHHAIAVFLIAVALAALANSRWPSANRAVSIDNLKRMLSGK